MKLDNETRQLNSLTTPVLMDRLISHRGIQGARVRRRRAPSASTRSIPTWRACTGRRSSTTRRSRRPPTARGPALAGLMAAATRPTTFAVSAFGGGRGGGRGGGSGSSVGEPGKGAPSLALVGQAGQGRGAAPNDPAPAGRGAAPAAPGAPVRLRPVAAAVAAGSVAGRPTTSSSWRATATRARSILTTGPTACRRCRSCRRMPGRPALIAVDGVLYTSTSNGCGAAPNGVWAIDLGQRPEEAGVVEDQRRERRRNGGTHARHGRHDLRGRRRRSGAAARRARPRTRTRSWPSSRRR